MYHIKMAFALVQIGTRIWVNPMQIQGVSAVPPELGPNCQTAIVVSAPNNYLCTDWPLDKVLEALKPAAVSRALEGK